MSNFIMIEDQFKTLIPQELLFQIHRVYFPTNHIIIRENQYNDFVYFLLEGSAESISTTATGIRHIHYQSTPGNFIGEIEVILKTASLCTVLTTSECHAFRIPNFVFKKIILHSPAFTQHLLTHLCESLALMSRYISINTKYSLKQRLMQFFLQKHQQFGNPFYVDKKLTADLFGCHLRSVNRVVKALEENKLLEYEKGKFRIPDLNKFKDALDHQE